MTQDFPSRLSQLLDEAEAGVSPAPPGGEAGGRVSASVSSPTDTPEREPVAAPAGSPGEGGSGTLAGAPLGTGGAGGLMNALLAHPELIRTIPTLIQTLGPLMYREKETASGISGSGQVSASADGIRTGASAPGGSDTDTAKGHAEAASAGTGTTGTVPSGARPLAAHPGRHDRHTPLLRALKPYLSGERRQAVDTVISLCQVWDSLQDAGINLTPLVSAMASAVGTTQTSGMERTPSAATGTGPDVGKGGM